MTKRKEYRPMTVGECSDYGRNSFILRKSGLRWLLIENLGIPKKILSKNDQRDIIKPRMRYKKTARFERLKYDYGNELR